jgi:hypothetical protein
MGRFIPTFLERITPMSQSIDPQTDSIEEPRDVVAPPEPAPENAHVAATEDADASAPEDPLASESALARESALAMQDDSESEIRPIHNPNLKRMRI